MKKIPSLFERDFSQRSEDGGHKVIDQWLDSSLWVARGEGVATRKWDGMAVRVKDSVVFKRYDAKAGRTPPPAFEPAQPAPDEKSGHWPGWLPAKMPDDRWIMEGIAWGAAHLYGGASVPDGTYEVCGPRIGTRHGPNPENLQEHILVVHGADVMDDCPRDYESLSTYLDGRGIEGVVWHHPDGRMAKIKAKDFPARLAPSPKM
jgi:hypothetical protein